MMPDPIWQRIALFALISMVFTPTVYGAPPPETPASLGKVTVVTAEKAWELTQKGVLIVDARVAHEYVDERIKGAVSIPYKEQSEKRIDYDPSLDSFDLSKLPPNKSTPIIFYCNAGQCWKSYKASKAAVRAGYTKIYWLRGGIPEWKEKKFPVE
jgi:rhodanese-related sulfurtransferase